MVPEIKRPRKVLEAPCAASPQPIVEGSIMADLSNSTALPEGKNLTRRTLLGGIASAAVLPAPSTEADKQVSPASIEDRIRWHMSEARCLLEEQTGRHWDLSVGMGDHLGFAIIIEREERAGGPRPDEFRFAPTCPALPWSKSTALL
jgi:hypothetical protein